MKEHAYLQSSLKFSVVIPAFNERENLEVLHTRLTKVMKSIGEPYEIVFVDDGSTDGSFQILRDLHQKDSNVKVIRFTRNFGQHIAMTAGLDHCKGENIIAMDADLQDQPEEIPKLLAKLRQGYDIVYGLRRKRRDNIFKRLSSKLYLGLLAKLTSQTVNPEIAPLRIMTRRVVDYMGQLRERSRFYGGLVAWLGFPYAVVDIEHSERFAGKTKYSFRKLLRHAAEGVISFSDVPLRLAGYFGIIVSIISFVFGLYYLIRRLVWGIPVPGYTSIIVAVFFLGGVLLIVLWVMGQYIGRIHTEVKERPLYVVRDMLE
jgi:glycosyltransferase involved in cell wall biosynthesis